jgi:chorismate mutase / prephenate dehydratase
MSINDWRSRINDLDRELLRLLNERAGIALKVGESKKEAGLSLCDHTREREVIERMCAANEGPLDDRAIIELYRAIIHESRRIQTRSDKAEPDRKPVPETEHLRVAFQGARGAFSEEAAHVLLGDQIEVVPRADFEALFLAVEDGSADVILAPIENSLAGFVHACYDLLLESKLHISREVIIPVNHYLIGCPGSSFEQITTAESHPVALMQCRRFLAANPQIHRVAAEDTAGSVARIIAAGDPMRAAIAGKRAARQYGGVILREHLEDSSENYTRFLLLTPAAEVAIDANKLSLVIELPHQPGALHKALEPFARREIDLLKIQSRPVKGRPWEYCFYLDVAGSPDSQDLKNALDELRGQRVETRVLGAYKAAAVPAV